MESRTRFAIGGMFTVVASIAVVSAVALTNSVALRVVLPVVPERPTGQEKHSTDSGRTTAAPTTPAQNAGSDAKRRSEMPGLGSKKDRSRDSPDRRD